VNLELEMARAELSELLTDVVIFKIFSPKKLAKKLAKKWRFLLKTKLKYAKF
jgi:hypothetical protein